MISNSLPGLIICHILPKIVLSSILTNFDIHFSNNIYKLIKLLRHLTTLVLKTSKYSLVSFKIPSTSLIYKLLLAVKSSCKIDPLSKPLQQLLSYLLASYNKNIIHQSLNSRLVPFSMKCSHVSPIIKKTSSNKY